ncbi:MAG: hypothetical protein Q4Q07_07895 [Tissierellia bacterium]|nr:hypothetical protein [Tissierellia bacterium]
MREIDWKQKLSSRKFWAAITAVVISLIAFFGASPETTERIVSLIAAIGGLCIYMLSEGISDIRPDIQTNVYTEDYRDLGE